MGQAKQRKEEIKKALRFAHLLSFVSRYSEDKIKRFDQIRKGELLWKNKQ